MKQNFAVADYSMFLAALETMRALYEDLPTEKKALDRDKAIILDAQIIRLKSHIEFLRSNVEEPNIDEKTTIFYLDEYEPLYKIEELNGRKVFHFWKKKR